MVEVAGDGGGEGVVGVFGEGERDGWGLGLDEWSEEEVVVGMKGKMIWWLG